MMPTAFLVNTTADSGAGSYRQAILDSNATPGLNTIDFGIGDVGSLQTIVPLSDWPSFTNPVVIDGDSQGGPGYKGPPLVVIQGGDAADAVCLVLAAGSDGSTIRGLVLNSVTISAIDLDSNNNLVESCYIGTDAQGNAFQSTTEGVRILGASNNTIGGATPGAGNVIVSGRDTIFIASSDRTASGDVVEGNLIGTNAAGTAAIGGGYGIDLEYASDSTIGGTAPAPGI